MSLVSARAAFTDFVIRQLRRIRRSLDSDSLATLIYSVVNSRMDYCNTVLAGAPRTVTDKLQRVLNATARVITGTRKLDRGLGQILHDQLHWLDVPDRVLFNLAVTVHQCLNGLATVSAGPKNPFFVSRRTTCYGRRTTCLVREDKVCPPSLSKRPTKLATNICQIWICPAWQVNSYC